MICCSLLQYCEIYGHVNKACCCWCKQKPTLLVGVVLLVDLQLSRIGERYWATLEILPLQIDKAFECSRKGYVHYTIWCGMNSNSTELEQVVHPNRTSRGFGSLNPSPHSWIFTSVSVGPSPLSSLFTSATIRNTCSHYTKVVDRTHPICDAPFTRSARRSFVPLQKSRRNQRSYMWTEALSGIAWTQPKPDHNPLRPAWQDVICN